MSTSDIRPISNAPLIIRTYTSDINNKSYILTDYDMPVLPNRILVTSMFGELVTSDSISVSNINVSTINGASYPPSDDAFWSGSLSGNISNDNTANVGIGTTNPQARLDVNGTVRATSITNDTIISINPDSNNIGEINALKISDSSSVPICLNTTGGNVGIGTFTPETRLDVNGTVRATQYILSNGAISSTTAFKNLISSSTTIINPGIYTIISQSIFLITIDLETEDPNNLGSVFGFIITDNSTQDVNIQVALSEGTYHLLSTINTVSNKNKLFLIYYQGSAGVDNDIGYTYL